MDETMLWFEFLIEAGIVPQKKLSVLRREAEELLKVTVAAIKRSRAGPKVSQT